MSRNRLPVREESLCLPRPPAPPPAPGSFAPCPAAPLATWSAGQQWLYEWAFEQARRAAQPSLPERDLAGVWN
jgi:hypothetical protein